MTTLTLRRRARELWATPYLQRQWVRSVLRLGDRWLLAQPVGKTA